MSRASLAEVEELAMSLPADEQLALVEHLAQNLRVGAGSAAPRDLFGIWRGKVPDNFDIDNALLEIRSAWTREETK